MFLTGLHIHGLAYAASGYHRVLEENRKLYNQVQDLKGNTTVCSTFVILIPILFGYPNANPLFMLLCCIQSGSIRVYCRVRPFLPGQNNYLSTVDHIEEGVITINTLAKNGKVRKSFNFNKVFGPSATQG